jgi:flagellar basal body rod protein FlgG
MNRGIYAGAKAMVTNTQWMDVVANNLANASTDGYKADTIAFADVMTRNMYAGGGAGQLLGSIGSGPDAVVESTDMSIGPIRSTGNPLDVALKDPSQLFSVRANGIVQYTRDGAFKIDDNRNLVTSQGYQVLDDRGAPIKFDKEGKYEIHQDGSVTVDGEQTHTVGVFTGEFSKAGKNLWTSNRPTRVLDIELATASREGSNVEPISAMIDLIKINRAFEMTQRSIQTQDEMSTKLLDALNRR